jgi:putative resolvase
MYSFFVTIPIKIYSSLSFPKHMCDIEHMKLSSYAKTIGSSYNSAWSMWKRGQLPGYQLPTGTVIIDPPELRSTPGRTVALYARVSLSENKDNLERQAERLISWCNA